MKFDEKQLLLAFEYGVVMSDVAKNMKVKLTAEIIARFEDILIKEFTTKDFDKVALEMVPNILAGFETK
jgi:hypothetical protein